MPFYAAYVWLPRGRHIPQDIMLGSRNCINAPVYHMKKLGPEIRITFQFMQLLTWCIRKENSTLLTSSFLMPLPHGKSIMWCFLDVTLLECGFGSWWVKDVGSVHRHLPCMNVSKASDTACYLWFWNLETFWKSFHWPASAQQEHPKANSSWEHNVMIYRTSSSSVKYASHAKPGGQRHTASLLCHELLIEYF